MCNASATACWVRRVNLEPLTGNAWNDHSAPSCGASAGTTCIRVLAAGHGLAIVARRAQSLDGGELRRTTKAGGARITMKRRRFITLLSGAAVAWPLAVRAQQAGMPLIGVLSPASPATSARNIAALRQGLRNLGYVEGRNIAIEYRFAEGISERLSRFATELVALKPVVIVVGSTTGILSASKITRTVPLIMVGATEDPVLLGLVESFTRPGSNVTGFMLSFDQEILGKRLQLLRDAIPGITRVGVMGNPDGPGDAAELRMVPSVAGRFGLQYRLLEVRTADALEAAFAAATRDNLQALYISWNPVFNVHRARIVGMLASRRLPAMYGFRDFVQSGGLMSYGPDLPDLYRRSATYVDKILKGENVGELPLQLAERYELVINLKTAKALGLEFPPDLLALADEVIE
jgi:putative ABC transport system substrate-binding protein